MSGVKPLVAIHCLVYNHEPYLRDCFEGFVMQQTNFPFVAIVHDDASTDGSAAIIREYEEKYPHMFKPIYEDSNVYSQGGFDAVNQIMNRAIDATGAKYVALCEGDDYWTNSYKLQKQVDFLETHDTYGFIGTKCKILKEQTLYDDKFALHYVKPIDGILLYGNIFLDYGIYGPVTRTCSLLFKKTLLDGENNSMSGDYFMQAVLASKSCYACIDDVLCVYRVHSGGVSNNRSDNAEISYIEWYINQKKQLKARFPNVCKFDENELNDQLWYKKMQIAMRNFDYVTYCYAKSNIICSLYKGKSLYKKINRKATFYIVGFIYRMKLKLL